MPSTFFGLNIAYTGLLAANAAQNTTANNIANVETPGYSRQQVTQQAANALRVFQTYGCAGGGVETLAIEQIRDEFYDFRFWSNNAKVGEYDEKQYYMTMIEDYFDDSPMFPGFKTIFDRMMITGMQELLKDPNSATAKSQFVGFASSLATYFNNLAGNMSKLQKDVNQELKLKVDELNSLAGEIATLNKQINTIELTGVKANELRDRRALLIDQLSQIVDVEVQEIPIKDLNDPDRVTGANRFMIKIAGGQLLVDGSEFNSLRCVARESYEKVNQTDIDGLYDVYWENGQKFNLYNAAMGGALRGLVEMRDGNNNEYFNGLITGVGTTNGGKNDTVTIQVGKDYLMDLNKCNLSDQGGIINLGNQLFYYDSWEYSISYDDDGNPVYSYTFTLSSDPELNARRLTNDRVGKTASVGTSVDYQGIPYYMNQMNEWLRTFAQKFNDILTSGYSSAGSQGIPMFSANHKTDPEQFDFPDEGRYDWYYGKTREQVIEDLKKEKYSEIYNDRYMEFENDFYDDYKNNHYNDYYVEPTDEEIAQLAEKLQDEATKNGQTLSDDDAKDQATQQLKDQATQEADKKMRKAAAAAADEAMKDDTVLAKVEQDAQDAAEAAFNGISFTVSSTSDSYYRMTAMNFAILAAMELDPSRLANRYGQGDGVEQNDLLNDLKLLATDKSKMSFRGCSASEFLQCVLSDVALNAQRANTFYQNFTNISGTIDVQRMSISGVDEDEEAVSLVKYQHGYNLACQMIQTLSEMYDRLILETGV
ncbi:MAG: flagellar hook-associated protein FlgK [Acetatifactor sp.]|nr:flagellar hook-associated protein FlgK [Acetatifactor sp.]